MNVLFYNVSNSTELPCDIHPDVLLDGSARSQHQNLAGCGGCIAEGAGILILLAVSFLQVSVC